MGQLECAAQFDVKIETDLELAEKELSQHQKTSALRPHVGQHK